MQRTWRILSIDGGGTRGIVPATILAHIEEQTGNSVCQLFDLVVGTSTGAILALALTKPSSNGQPEITARQLCAIYERDIPRIFQHPRSWWGNLLTPKYRSAAFKQVLESAFADCTLKSALCDVLVPSFDIEHRLPYMFRSRLAREQSEHDFLMRDVALAASATPTLFDPVHFPRSSGDRFISLVDGGVFANNPAICALAESKAMFQGDDVDFFLISIGTGKSLRPLTKEMTGLWGYVRWSRPMLDLVLESISEAVHEQMKSLLPVAGEQCYYRLQIDLRGETPPYIDNASTANVQALSQSARDFCSGSVDLRRACEALQALSLRR
jgi:uncharacterized protein